MTKTELDAAVNARLAQIETALDALDDETARLVTPLFPAWEEGTSYTRGQRLRYLDRLWRVEQDHTSQRYWTPPTVPALYTEIAEPDAIPVWRQPTGAQDAYMAGDRVCWPDESGPVFVSLLDANTWEPGVYGWEMVE